MGQNISFRDGRGGNNDWLTQRACYLAGAILSTLYSSLKMQGLLACRSGAHGTQKPGPVPNVMLPVCVGPVAQMPDGLAF